jgi:hypothetical protein
MLITSEQFRDYASNTKYADESIYTDEIIEPYIEIASIYLENYLNRKLLAEDYIEFFSTNFADTILANQYPINYVNGILIHPQNVFSYILNEGVSVTINTFGESVKINVCDEDGEVEVYSFDKSEYKNTESLVAEINSEVEHLEAMLIKNIPLKFLSEISETKKVLSKGNIMGYADFMEGFAVSDEDDRTIFTSYNVPKGILYYNAGYEVLPSDLVLALVNLIMILLQLAENKQVNLNEGKFKSESMGDYSYILFNQEELKSEIELYFLKNEALLEKYKKIVI